MRPGNAKPDRPKPRRRAPVPRSSQEVGPISTLSALAPAPRGIPSPATVDARSPRVQRLFRRHARFGDTAARDELVERFLPLARGLARRYHRGTEPLDDLIQVASIGLVNAIDRFDPERGRDFTTYAVPTIIGELKRHYRDRCWAMKVVRSDKERVLELVAAVDLLAARHGREPTAIELAAHTGLTVDAVLDGLELAPAARPESLDEPRRGATDEPGTLGHALGAPDPALELVVLSDLVDHTVRVLSPRERRVLHLRFAEDLTQREIGAEIGVTQMHVSRILRQAVDRSRECAAVTRASTPEAPSA